MHKKVEKTYKAYAKLDLRVRGLFLFGSCSVFEVTWKEKMMTIVAVTSHFSNDENNPQEEVRQRVHNTLNVPVNDHTPRVQNDDEQQQKSWFSLYSSSPPLEDEARLTFALALDRSLPIGRVGSSTWISRLSPESLRSNGAYLDDGVAGESDSDVLLRFDEEPTTPGRVDISDSTLKHSNTGCVEKPRLVLGGIA